MPFIWGIKVTFRSCHKTCMKTKTKKQPRANVTFSLQLAKVAPEQWRSPEALRELLLRKPQVLDLPGSSGRFEVFLRFFCWKMMSSGFFGWEIFWGKGVSSFSGSEIVTMEVLVDMREKEYQLSHEKKPGWLFYIRDYTTQLYRDYNKPL